MWQALKLKFQGSVSMIKSKKALIKKEFDIFTGIKGETTKQLIERYCHLVVEMKRLEITKTNEEWIDKLCDALPYDEWGTYLMMLKNNSDFVNLNLSSFIEKIEAHELELLKIKKMNSASVQQDVSLYYKGNTPVATLQSPKIQMGFIADNTSSASSNTPQSSNSSPFMNFEPNAKAQEQPSPQSSTGSNNQAYVSGVQCNIAVNIKNGNEITKTAAKQHIALLASVLEAYEGLVAGRIGNPDMTKVDYDQIDPEELELIDIKWGMASLVRRAQRFMEITGQNSLSGPDQKLGFDKSKVTCFKCKERGHLKRECPNREVNNHQNPFTNDYYRQAIYHRPNQQPAVQRPQIENKPEKALIVNQDHEKVAAGFSWDKYIPGSDGQAMMAEVVEISEMVSEPEIVAEDISEVFEEVSAENVVDLEEIAAEVYYYQSEHEVILKNQRPDHAQDLKRRKKLLKN
ncbi:putative transcription factor interactor and regulator CCHC(Zn) family [Helianthus annuus]|nr:putative transcription factor interactor and regulator CCHC(Zn) family [Helianthus annuus]